METKPTFTTDAPSETTDYREHSPSTGWRETAAGLDCPTAHRVEPVDADSCGALGCHAGEDLYHVETTDRKRVLCPTHTRDFVDTEVVG